MDSSATSPRAELAAVAPLIALAIPIAIMTALFTWAIRMRIKYHRSRNSPLATEIGNLEVGSSDEIVDGGQVPWRDLLDALAVKPEGSYHEGWMGTMLGLKTKWSTSTNVLEPHRMWGERHGRKVSIRLGPDEKIEGGTTMFSNKHIRAITKVEAAFPEFELRGENGALSADGDPPQPVWRVLGRIGLCPEVWDDLTVTAGAGGIVANRPIIGDALNSWIYDLWLCERLADQFGAP